MGKGSGSCSRPALSFAGPASSGSVQPAYEDAASRALRLGQQRYDAGWEVDLTVHPQPSWDALRDELSLYPGEMRALFYRDSLLSDGAVYYEEARGSQGLSVILTDEQITTLETWAIPDGMHFGQTSYFRRRLRQLGEADSYSEIPLDADRLEWLQHYFTVGGSTSDSALATAEKLATRINEEARFERHAVERQRAEAHVSAAEEEAFIARLVALGATIEEHQIDLPRYQSVHKVRPGRRFILRNPDGSELSYVPHYSLGTEPEELMHIDGNFSFNRERVTALLAAQEAACYHQQDQLFSVNGDVYTKADYPTLTDAEIQSGETVQEHAHRDSGLSMDLVKGMPLHPATAEELDDAEYTLSERGWHRYDDVSSLVDPMDVETLGDFGSRIGTMYLPASATEQEQQAAINSRIHSVFEELAAADMESEEKLAGEAYDWITDMKDLSAFATVNKRTFVGRKLEPQEAPYSERGRLSVEHAAPEVAQQLLQDVGAIGEQVTAVPYTELYRSPIHRGHLTPWHDDYASGRRPIPTADAPIVHGMTGATGKDMLQRLKSIGDTGGLRSIADRRRSAIRVSSLSPLGDIASGIDEGVPFAITDEPEHGSGIHFIAKPATIARRDLWFAPQDFGGGSSRWGAFNNYARTLGQDNMHEPPSDAARVQHLKTATADNGRSDNEVYFKHQLAVHEIGAILVDDDMLDEVKTIVKEWRDSGRISELPLVKSSYEMSFNELSQRVRRRFSPRRRSRKKPITA